MGAWRCGWTLRFDFGSSVLWVTRLDDRSGIQAVSGPNLVVLRAGVPLKGEGQSTVAEFTVEAGRSFDFALSCCESHLAAPAAFGIDGELERTEAFWRDWAGNCTYRSRCRSCASS